MHFQLSDVFSAGTLLVALGIYRKINIIVFQHKLMWADFAQKKGLDVRVNGKAAAAGD